MGVLPVGFTSWILVLHENDNSYFIFQLVLHGGNGCQVVRATM